jgi:hypothetical protein
MKEQEKSASGEVLKGGVIFFTGLIVALIGGWIVFPNLLFSQKTQPINFSHLVHEEQGSSCEDCHSFRTDGTYTGIPKIEKCKECHESQVGQTEDERILVEEYIEKGKEIPWRIYAWQPDNVYFSHAPHSAKGVDCVECHRSVAKEQKLPVFKENRLTGYSLQTMTMEKCENCHADRGVTNECEMCHK